MRQGGLSLLLVLTLILSVGTIVQDFRFDTSLARERASALSTDRELGSIDVALSDLRAAQTAYLAAGQSPDFWMRRVTEVAGQVESTVGRLRAVTASADARTRYDAATTALADFMSVDQRARGLVKSEQRLMTEDLVFMDGLDTSQRIASELSAARAAEWQASEARGTRLARLRFGMNALVLGFVLIVAVFASRGRGHAAAAPASTAQMLRDLPPPVKSTPASSPLALSSASPASSALSGATTHTAIVTAPVAVATTPRVVVAPPPPPSVNPAKLGDAAELCVDLARVMDGRDVPALLERAARILDAKGVIIWTVGGDGSRLEPSLTHGYSEKVVNRMGTLPLDADNVTSLAFRSLRAQAMNAGSEGSSGAIAVPLITAAGCTGVMAAEVKDGKPASELLSVARIIAAQFSSLIGPPEASGNAARVVEA